LESYDFDEKVQERFNASFSDITPINWQNWLDISSKEEYEELSLKLSGLSSIDDILNKIKTETTDSRDFSIDLKDFLAKSHESDSLIFCHTSGTTNSNLSMLKWFYMTKDLVKKQWAPGMQAIFESSGLNSKSSVIIFVPSRLKFDGFNNYEDKEYISLYSSEFSQRIMLSVIKPLSYLFYEYKNSKNLEILSKILTIENISVISAPATTILGWADISKLKTGLKKSLNTLNQTENPLIEEYLLKIKRKGLDFVSKDIYTRLSEKISKATLVFSISSLSEFDWALIRKFMRWKKGEEKFTNLYVASEIGPFAASITKEDFEISRLNRMYIFPLTLPVIEYQGKKELISRTKNDFGKLYVSRLNNSKILINIDIGDIIHITNKEGVPQMEGKILRSQFQLKYPINLSNQIRLKSDYKTYAGDYLIFNDFEIIEPRALLNHLKEICQFPIDALLLIKDTINNDFNWTLVVPSSKNLECSTEQQVREIILKYKSADNLNKAIVDDKIKIKIIEEQPVNFLATREKILTQVRSGKLPKGILKKWPLYVVEPV